MTKCASSWLYLQVRRLVLLCVLVFSSSTSPSLAETPTPTASGYRGSTQVESYQGAFADLAIEVDRFWAETFDERHGTYTAPNIVVVDRPMQTACGLVQPVPNAFYCPLDWTIYLVPEFLAELDAKFGDYAPMTVFSHEWGHHVQNLLGLRKTEPARFELQADCLMGVFTRYARDQQLLDGGDVLEGLDTSKDGGDPVFLPEDDPRAHGTSEERVLAVTQGFWLGPVDGCGLPLSSIPGTRATESVDSGSHNTGGGSEGPSGTSAARVPTTLPLAHARCFSVIDGGPLSFSQLLDRFSGFPDASARLQGWGWQASAYRQFGCDGPPEGDAGWIDISVHGFSSAASAQEAADYFAAARLDGTSLRRADGPGVGDYSIALVGPASNGTEFTIYATRGPWLVRVTGVSPSGIPFMNVRTVAIDVLEAQNLGGASSAPQVTDGPASALSLPSETYLPNSPSLNYAACFRTHSSGTLGYGDVREAFARTSAGAGAADTYGWQDGAWVVFTCDDPPFGHARQLDVIIHQFRDASAAQQVSSAVKAFQIPGDHESRACDTAGALVICVTGYADTGSPLSDVYFVLNQVVAGAQ